MKTLKREEDRRIKITVCISPVINDMLIDNTKNKSRYIELSLLEYFKKCGLDTSKIKL